MSSMSSHGSFTITCHYLDKDDCPQDHFNIDEVQHAVQ